MTLIGHLIGSFCKDAEMDHEWTFYSPQAVSKQAQSSVLAGVHAAVVSVILTLLWREIGNFCQQYTFYWVFNEQNALLESLGGIDFSSLGEGVLCVFLDKMGSQQLLPFS